MDIGASGIKVVELRKTKGRPQLWTYGAVDQPLDIHLSAAAPSPEPIQQIPAKAAASIEDKRINEYGQLLRGLLKAARVTARGATASLPVSQVFHAVITLPVVESKELEHHVRAKIKKILPRPIEEMQVLHQVIPAPAGEKNTKAIKVLVTAAPLELISFYTGIFSKVGVHLAALETEAFALERSLVGLDKSTAMIVDIGAERTNFFIIDQGLPVTHRTIEIGGQQFDKEIMERLKMPASMVSQVKMDMGHLAENKNWHHFFTPLIDPIAKEIQYGFDLFLHQSGNEQKHPEKIILTGGASLFPPVSEIIQGYFPIKVFIGDPWARVVYQQDLKALIDPLGPRMSVAVGLAMRGMRTEK